MAFLVAQKVKNPPAVPWLARDCRCKRPGFIAWFGKILLGRQWLTTPVFLPGESHGQRSLERYSPWGHKQSDMTEWPTLIWILIQVLTPGLIILSLVILLDLSLIKTSWDSNQWGKRLQETDNQLVLYMLKMEMAKGHWEEMSNKQFKQSEIKMKFRREVGSRIIYLRETFILMQC